MHECGNESRRHEPTQTKDGSIKATTGIRTHAKVNFGRTPSARRCRIGPLIGLNTEFMRRERGVERSVRRQSFDCPNLSWTPIYLGFKPRIMTPGLVPQFPGLVTSMLPSLPWADSWAVLNQRKQSQHSFPSKNEMKRVFYEGAEFVLLCLAR